MIAGDYLCNCPDGYEGANCGMTLYESLYLTSFVSSEIGPTPTPTPTGTDSSPSVGPTVHYISIIAVAIVMLVICSIVFIVIAVFCIWRMRHHVNETTGKGDTGYIHKALTEADPEPEAYELDWRVYSKR